MLELNKIEESLDIPKAIEYIADNQNKNIINYLRVLFVITYFLKEEPYNEKEYLLYTDYLKKIFLESSKKYSDNAEFLFYTGFIISMGEWYFNLTFEQSVEMMTKASEIEPKNELYQWVYFFYLDKKNKKKEYAKHLLGKKTIQKELYSKGLLGIYIYGIIEYAS